MFTKPLPRFVIAKPLASGAEGGTERSEQAFDERATGRQERDAEGF